MADIFVSYSQEDEAAARSLKTALAEQGNKVWLAGGTRRGLGEPPPWRRVIELAVEVARG